MTVKLAKSNLSAKVLIGQVMHKRTRPAKNKFTYPVFFLQIPLRNLACAENWLLRIDKPGIMSLHQKDYGPLDGSSLLVWIENILAEHNIVADGEIVLQTFPRLWGYSFNPVSFWFCYNKVNELVAVLAEVRNTFGGHHSYLLYHQDKSPINNGHILSTEKAFHVSPFCDVEGSYQFQFSSRSRSKICRINYFDSNQKNEPILITSIGGRESTLDSSNLLYAALRMPLLTFGITFRIHYQAFLLYLKKVPFIGSLPKVRT